MRKFVIIDYFLRENRGHDECYDFSIADEAIRKGIKTEIWCPKRKDKNQPDFVKQCLKSPDSRKKGMMWKLIVVIARTIEFNSIFKRKTLDTNTLILIPSIDSHFLLALTIGTLGLKFKPKIIILLRRGLNDSFYVLGYFKSKIKNLITNPFLRYLYKKNVMFYSDSELITGELKEKGFRNTKTLPIPHLPPKKINNSRNHKLSIGYFGGARFEKGFDILPNIIDSIIRNNQEISFIIQSFLIEKSDKMRQAQIKLDTLCQSYPDKIILLDKYLSTKEYTENIKKCSIFLIPYRKKLYGKGTSGILAEAIACGAWAVVPTETWMAKQSEKYAKIIEFDSFSSKVIISAIDACIYKENILNRVRIKNQIKNWYYFHSSTNYINILEASLK
jgi:glycosyltransferase involved in cell wall biosynthesis